MSRAVVRIPTPLRSFTAGADEVTAEGATVGEVLRALGERHQGILAKVLDDAGKVRPFVNVYLGKQNVKALGGLEAEVGDGDVVSIVPAVAGGRP